MGVRIHCMGEGKHPRNTKRICKTMIIGMGVRKGVAPHLELE